MIKFSWLSYLLTLAHPNRPLLKRLVMSKIKLFVLGVSIFAVSQAYAGDTDLVIDCINRGGGPSCQDVKSGADVNAVTDCVNRGGREACQGVQTNADVNAVINCVNRGGGSACRGVKN